MRIRGKLGEFFETGTEGVYFSLQDEKHIDDKGMYSYKGLHLLKNGDHLEILYGEDEKVLWSGKLGMISSMEAMRDKYFRQYIKTVHKNTQLSFGGRWVHNLPVNVDLGIWYHVFCANPYEFTGVLKPAKEKKGA